MASNDQEVNRILLANVPALGAEFERLKTVIQRLEEEKVADLEKIRDFEEKIEGLEHGKTELQQECRNKEMLLLQFKNFEATSTELRNSVSNNAVQFLKLVDAMKDQTATEANLAQQIQSLQAKLNLRSENQDSLGARISEDASQSLRQTLLTEDAQNDEQRHQNTVGSTDDIRSPDLSQTDLESSREGSVSSDDTSAALDDNIALNRDLRQELVNLFDKVARQGYFLAPHEMNERKMDRKVLPYPYLRMQYDIELKDYSRMSEVERDYNQFMKNNVWCVDCKITEGRAAVLNETMLAGIERIKAKHLGSKPSIVEANSKELDRMNKAILDEPDELNSRKRPSGTSDIADRPAKHQKK